jgi:hypothetical protein
MLSFPASSMAAQSTARPEVVQDSRLWTEGTSNIEDWTCQATMLDAHIEVDVGFAKTPRRRGEPVDRCR